MDVDPNEQFAGNTSINLAIHEILTNASEPSRSRMIGKIRQVRDAVRRHQTDETDAHARHVFREFVMGDHLNRNGFQLEYDKKIGDQTPDWFDEPNRLVVEVYTCERGGTSNPVKRVAGRIIEKIDKYTKAIEDRALHFVVAIHGDFISCYDREDCERTINDSGLFNLHAGLSGIIFFESSNLVFVPQPDGSRRLKQLYDFMYFANPNATRSIDLTAKLGYG